MAASWPVFHIALLCPPEPPRPASFALFFCEAYSTTFRVRLRPRQSLRIFGFRNSTHCHHPSLKRRCSDHRGGSAWTFHRQVSQRGCSRDSPPTLGLAMTALPGQSGLTVTTPGTSCRGTVGTRRLRDWSRRWHRWSSRRTSGDILPWTDRSLIASPSRAVRGPHPFHEFASCVFYQIFAVITQIHTDGAGKFSHIPSKSHVSEEFFVVPGISFLRSVKYVNFMGRKSALDLFPLQRSCTYPFSPL